MKQEISILNQYMIPVASMIMLPSIMNNITENGSGDLSVSLVRDPWMDNGNDHVEVIHHFKNNITFPRTSYILMLADSTPSALTLM